MNAPRTAMPRAAWRDCADRQRAAPGVDAELAQASPKTMAALAAVTGVALLSGVVLMFGAASEPIARPAFDARARQAEIVVVARADTGDTGDTGVAGATAP